MIGYFQNNGDITNPIVSHSGLCLLEDHPLNFKEHIERSEDTVVLTPSLERGDLLHKWLEKPDEFVFAELDKPSPQMSLFSETFNTLYFKEGWKTDEGFIAEAEQPFSIDLKDRFVVQELYSSFFGEKASDEAIQLLSRCILYARKKAEVDKRLTDSTIFKKFETECSAYIRFLHNAGNRIIVSKQDKEVLINAYQSLRSHPIASQYLDSSFQSEVELYWTEKVEDIIIQRKGKVDKLKFENNKLTIVDTKTTNYAIKDFREGAYKKWRLGRQLLSYAIGYCFQNNINFSDIEIDLINVVVQTNRNYPTAVFKVTEKEKYNLLVSYRNIMDRAAFHISKQIWDITLEEAVDGFIPLGELDND
jgi:hypothetical protein